jgi:hypothetical protein
VSIKTRQSRWSDTQLLTLASRVSLGFRLPHIPRPYFSIQNFFSCYEMGPPLRREKQCNLPLSFCFEVSSGTHQLVLSAHMHKYTCPLQNVVWLLTKLLLALTDTDITASVNSYWTTQRPIAEYDRPTLHTA